MGAKRGEEEEEEEEGDEARILPPQGAFSRLASRQRSLPHWEERYRLTVLLGATLLVIMLLALAVLYAKFCPCFRQHAKPG